MQAIFLIFLLFLGCGPHCSDDFLAEGEAKTRQLFLILKRVETKEDLLRVEPLLKKKFQEMAGLIANAQDFLQQNPHELGSRENRYSDDLLRELRRLYKIPGAREIIERASQELQTKN